jgi:hypothetical protein
VKATNDAGATADSAPSDYSGATSDPNALIEDRFESSALCTPWTVYRGTGAASAPAHGGNASCKLCSTQAGAGVGMARVIKPKAPATSIPAGQYLFNVWLRAAPSTPAVAVELYELAPSNQKGTYLGGIPVSPVVSDQWIAAQFSYTLTAPSSGWFFDIYIDGNPPADTCFVADDVTVTLIP